MMPNNLGTVLVFMTFGTLAPLLGLVIITALFAEVYIIELVMGRFLVREISVILYSKRNVPMIDGFKYEHVAISTDPKIQKQADDVDKDWGSIAAVKEGSKAAKLSCKTLATSKVNTSVSPMSGLFSILTL